MRRGQAVLGAGAGLSGVRCAHLRDIAAKRRMMRHGGRAPALAALAAQSGRVCEEELERLCCRWRARTAARRAELCRSDPAVVDRSLAGFLFKQRTFADGLVGQNGVAQGLAEIVRAVAVSSAQRAAFRGDGDAEAAVAQAAVHLRAALACRMAGARPQGFRGAVGRHLLYSENELDAVEGASGRGRLAYYADAACLSLPTPMQGSL